MSQTVEATASRPHSAIFKDWSLYTADKISPQLPKRIKYTAPQPNEELRKRIAGRERQFNEFDTMVLKNCLSFLEEGYIEDDFYANHEERHDFLMANTIRVGDEEITLHLLAKRMNKLSTNAIAQVTGLDSLIYDPSLKKRMYEMNDKITTIEKDRHYFLTSDLPQIDDLANAIINHILR